MKRAILICAVLLTGCGTAVKTEEVGLRPYNIETARKAALKAQECAEIDFEVADAEVYEETHESELNANTEASEESELTSTLQRTVHIEEPVEDIVQEEYTEVYQEEATAEELPPPADSFEDVPQNYIGTYTVTWYSREAVGYDAPGASGNGLTPGYSCAMPSYDLLNCTILVEGYGIYHVDDVSPAGICDLYVSTNAEIPGYGMDTANIYIIG